MAGLTPPGPPGCAPSCARPCGSSSGRISRWANASRSSSRPKPTRSVSSPSVRLKSPTTGIEPPEPMVTGLAAPFVLQARPCACRAPACRRDSCDRARALVLDELDRAIGRDARAHERLEGVADLLAGPGRRRGGTRPWRCASAAITVLVPSPGVAADDAVDVAGRARLDLLDQHAVRLAGRELRPTCAQETPRP